jgi:hypothetical protein
MKNNPNHGNRIHPVGKAYEIKKQRNRERYASTHLRLNPLWRHNRILRDLANKYGSGVEITIKEFEERGFDSAIYKSTSNSNNTTYYHYDKHIITITNRKTILIWKISI